MDTLPLVLIIVGVFVIIIIIVVVVIVVVNTSNIQATAPPTCSSDNDCGTGLVCYNYLCRPAVGIPCQTTADCKTGLVCTNSYCAEPGVSASAQPMTNASVKSAVPTINVDTRRRYVGRSRTETRFDQPSSRDENFNLLISIPVEEPVTPPENPPVILPDIPSFPVVLPSHPSIVQTPDEIQRQAPGIVRQADEIQRQAPGIVRQADDARSGLLIRWEDPRSITPISETSPVEFFKLPLPGDMITTPEPALPEDEYAGSRVQIPVMIDSPIFYPPKAITPVPTASPKSLDFDIYLGHRSPIPNSHPLDPRSPILNSHPLDPRSPILNSHPLDPRSPILNSHPLDPRSPIPNSHPLDPRSRSPILNSHPLDPRSPILINPNTYLAPSFRMGPVQKSISEPYHVSREDEIIVPIVPSSNRRSMDHFSDQSPGSFGEFHPKLELNYRPEIPRPLLSNRTKALQLALQDSSPRDVVGGHSASSDDEINTEGRFMEAGVEIHSVDSDNDDPSTERSLYPKLLGDRRDLISSKSTLNLEIFDRRDDPPPASRSNIPILPLSQHYPVIDVCGFSSFVIALLEDGTIICEPSTSAQMRYRVRSNVWLTRILKFSGYLYGVGRNQNLYMLPNEYFSTATWEWNPASWAPPKITWICTSYDDQNLWIETPTFAALYTDPSPNGIIETITSPHSRRIYGRDRDHYLEFEPGQVLVYPTREVYSNIVHSNQVALSYYDEILIIPSSDFSSQYRAIRIVNYFPYYLSV